MMIRVLVILLALGSFGLFEAVRPVSALSREDWLSGGMIWGVQDKIYLSVSQDFDSFGSTFNSGETVYLKIETDRVKRLKGVNQVYVLDKFGVKTDIKARITQAGPGEYRASLFLDDLIDGQYFVEVKVSGLGVRNRPERLMLTQAILVGEAESKIEYYQVRDNEALSLGVGLNRDLGLRLDLGNGGIERQSFMVYDLAGNRQKVSQVEVVNQDGAHEFNLTFLDLFLQEGQWYWLSYDLTVDSGKRYRGAKAFYVSDRLPVALITTPEEKDAISGVVEIKGTAGDPVSDSTDVSGLFYSYFLESVGGGGESLPIIDEQFEAVSEDFLGKWETDAFEKGEYVLRLSVVDYVGNASSFEVGVRLKASSKKFRLTAPKKIDMAKIEVATFSQVSLGQIGDQAGKKGIEVEDDRGAYTGWSVTGSMTDFVANEEVISLANLLISPQQVMVVAGQSEGVMAGSSVRPEAGQIFSFITADVGYGNGKYQQQVLLNLDVPANPVVGEYRSQLTITLQ